jgi:hypothetical protein
LRVEAIADLSVDELDAEAWGVQEEDHDKGGPESSEAATSAAVAVIGLVDWISRRHRGERLSGSPEFLSQLTLPTTGRLGAVTLRDTIKTLRRYGAPPQELGGPRWRTPNGVPDPRNFAFSREYEELRYRRLDGPAAPPDAVLARLRRRLRQGVPCVFGFSVLDSINSGPWVPFTPGRSIVLGGAAAIVMGYDDSIRGPCGVGALRVRCCWGVEWGDRGDGWLPYGYVTQGLARDFWELSFDATL